MIIRTILQLVIVFVSVSSVFAQKETNDSSSKKHSIGNSLFKLANFPNNETTNFYQLNYSYRITPKDAISMEFITWDYYVLLGISMV